MSYLRAIIKRLVHPILLKWYEHKNQRTRIYKHRGLEISILPEVFHPAYFLSTTILLDFILTKEVKSKKILELGAGSGFISFYLAKNSDVFVTASDINPNAIEGLKINREKLQLDIEIVHSNLFENIDLTTFDFILINPPYYPKTPDSMRFAAFYCGEDFDYFKRLFESLTQKNKSTSIYMILSEDCEIDHISSLAEANNLTMIEEFRTKKMTEMNYIFKIIKNDESN